MINIIGLSISWGSLVDNITLGMFLCFPSLSSPSSSEPFWYHWDGVWSKYSNGDEMVKIYIQFKNERLYWDNWRSEMQYFDKGTLFFIPDEFNEVFFAFTNIFLLICSGDGNWISCGWTGPLYNSSPNISSRYSAIFSWHSKEQWFSILKIKGYLDLKKANGFTASLKTSLNKIFEVIV